MKLSLFALLIASCMAISVNSESITASFSLLRGSISNIPWKEPVYPILNGVFNSSYTPGYRYGHRIIVYNGLVYSFQGYPRPGSEVWKFDPDSKQWAMLFGNSSASGVSYNFGTRGIASPSNSPGYRLGFGGDLREIAGQYILFGGSASLAISDYRGDLWSFDLVSNMWTWIVGASSAFATPVYSSFTTLTPGARYAPAFAYYPPSDTLTLFGGFVPTATFYGDVWSFSFSTERWTFISGTTSTTALPVYGLKGQWSSAFRPSRRYCAEFVYSSRSRLLFLFGGSSGGTSYSINELWAFKRSTYVWAWLSGSSTDALGVYGTVGVPSVSNIPPGRHSHFTAYHASSGLLLIYGGLFFEVGYESAYLGDFWAFNETSFEWTWISGESSGNSPAVYRNGLEAPAASAYGSMAVEQVSGAIYIFGGLNDAISDYGSMYIDHMWNICVDSSAFKGCPPLEIAPPLNTSTTVATISHNQVTDGITVSKIASKHSSVRKTSMQEDVTNPASWGNFGNILGPQTRIYLYISIGGLLIIIIITCTVRLHWLQSVHIKTGTGPSDAPSTISGSLEKDSSTSLETSTDTSAQSTMVTTTLGLYVPGGLQVNANTAYRTEKEIARGGGGSVWLAKAFETVLTHHGPTVIVKIPNTPILNGRAMSLFHQEIALMNVFRNNNKNIVQLLGYTENPCSIIVKYYPGGSLSKWILRRQLTSPQTLNFLTDIASGLSSLHYYGIVHCDLKPDNILIDQQVRLTAVLADFGIARIISAKLLKVQAYEIQKINGASVAYAAPEALREFRSEKAFDSMDPEEVMSRDVYALGVIICVMLNQRSAWK